MKPTCHLILILLSFQVNAQLTGTINYEKIGVSFDIPQGWVGQEADNMLIMGSNTTPGMIIMTTHTYSKNELIQVANMGIDEGNGTILRLEDQLNTSTANAVMGNFRGTLEWQPAKAFIIGVTNPNGVGASIMAVTTPEEFGSVHEEVCRQIYSSLKFSKVDRNAELKEWKDWLSDSRLTYMDSYYSSDYTDDGFSGGSSSETKIDLCARGYFNMASSNEMTFSGSGSSGYSYGNDGGQGTWNISIGADGNFLLTLTYNDGSEEQYTMTYEDEKFYLDGVRYFVTSEGEYAPNCD